MIVDTSSYDLHFEVSLNKYWALANLRWASNLNLILVENKLPLETLGLRLYLKKDLRQLLQFPSPLLSFNKHFGCSFKDYSAKKFNTNEETAYKTGKNAPNKTGTVGSTE